jgi:large repetitive protein
MTGVTQMIRRLFQDRHNPSKPKARPIRSRSLRLESLECRELMSVTPTVAIAGCSAAAQSAYVSSQIVKAAVSTSTMQYGGIWSGNLRSASTPATVTFNGKAGELIQIATAASGFTPRTELVAPSGKVVSIWTYPGEFPHSVQLEENGVYTIRVKANNSSGTGTCQVGLERISSPSLDATSLSIGKVVSGRISAGLEKDQYTFTLKAGQTIQFSLAGSGIDVFAHLYEPGGNQKAVEVYAHQTQTFTAQSAGVYILQIQDRNVLKTGTYKVGVESIYAASPDASTLTVGQKASAKITSELQKDQYKVYLKAGQKVQFNFTNSGINVYAKLYDPAGNDKMTMTRVNQAYKFTAQSAGWYVLQVQDWNLIKTGSYTVKCSKG